MAQDTGLNQHYLVLTFSIEPASETRGLSGSLGRVAPDGGIDWHLEVIQMRREPFKYTRGAALAVLYMRIEEHEHQNVTDANDVRDACSLIERLLAPKEWAARRPLEVNLLSADPYTGVGKALGGNVYSNVIYDTGRGPIGADSIGPAFLEQNPEIALAIKFYVRGVAAADQRFLPDALMSYARCLECVVGSAKHPDFLRRECDRLGLDTDKILELLRKTRNRFAIAHALDIVKGRIRKLKELPSPEMEHEGRSLAESAIVAYLQFTGPADHELELAKGIRYQGLPPVDTNLPLPREVLCYHMGPWDHAAPGLAPDWDSLPNVARRLDMRESKLRGLVRRHRIRGFKEGSRWQVSSISAELYNALSEETAKDHTGRIYQQIPGASEDSGFSANFIRNLVRQRRLPGRIRGRILRDVVDVNSLRYFSWRRRRERVVRVFYRRRL